MNLRWYQAFICDGCVEFSQERCSQPGCIMWLKQAGRPLGNDFSLVRLSEEMVQALDVAREFDRGLQLEH